MATVALDGGRFGVAAEDLTRQGTWLVSRRYDLAFIILSAAFVLFPHLSYAVMGKNIYVDLTVTLLIGGPHLFATYTMTFMEPHFRRTYPRYTSGALALPPIIVTLAVLNLTLLVTFFFLWASLHVIHQVAYVTDAYRMKDPRGWSRTGKLIDYGLLFTALYPISTQKLIHGQFVTGGRVLLFPEFLKQPWVPIPVWIAFIGFAVAFVARSVWERKHGLFHGPKTLLVALSAVLFFVTPMVPNLDIAFQGLNTWHSFQYLALVLFLNQMRARQGMIGSTVVSAVSQRGWRLYAFCLGFTLLAGVAFLGTLGVVRHLGAFATGPNIPMIFYGSVHQDQHFFSFYSVVLSCLLIHYYFDHFLFLQKDQVITPSFARASAARVPFAFSAPRRAASAGPSRKAARASARRRSRPSGCLRWPGEPRRGRRACGRGRCGRRGLHAAGPPRAARSGASRPPRWERR